jgi:hypothetical protein
VPTAGAHAGAASTALEAVAATSTTTAAAAAATTATTTASRVDEVGHDKGENCERRDHDAKRLVKCLEVEHLRGPLFLRLQLG